jgi:hypothetical protein
MNRRGQKTGTRKHLRLLAQLAELQAEIARKPLSVHQARMAALKAETVELSERRAALRDGVDSIADSDLPIAAAAYLAARNEDLGWSLAERYQTMARAEVAMSEVKNTAARARARADVLERLSNLTSRR